MQKILAFFVFISLGRSLFGADDSKLFPDTVTEQGYSLLLHNDIEHALKEGSDLVKHIQTNDCSAKADQLIQLYKVIGTLEYFSKSPFINKDAAKKVNKKLSTLHVHSNKQFEILFKDIMYNIFDNSIKRLEEQPTNNAMDLIDQLFNPGKPTSTELNKEIIKKLSDIKEAIKKSPSLIMAQK